MVTDVAAGDGMEISGCKLPIIFSKPILFDKIHYRIFMSLLLTVTVTGPAVPPGKC